MNEPPSDLNVDELLPVVQRYWDSSVETLEHLTLGFGAHHWQARADGQPCYFVTLDGLGARHPLETLRMAYAGAAAVHGPGELLSYERPETIDQVRSNDGPPTGMA